MCDVRHVDINDVVERFSECDRTVLSGFGECLLLGAGVFLEVILVIVSLTIKKQD